MQKRVEIPNKPRFSLATQRAYQLLAELGVSEFPIDPRKIIEHFPSWHLKGWLELSRHTDEEDPLYLDRDNAEAKTVKLRNGDDYLIVYDERVDNFQRIRWTLAHEIGHIVMGHLVEFNATALNRRGLTKDEYGVLEVEAHWFAADLLAPKTIIRRYDFQDQPQGIGLICDISKDAAEKRLKEMKRQDFGYFPTENAILRNFFNHLLVSQDYNQVMHETASKFYPSSIYSDLCKECRICKACNSFIPNAEYKYCIVCGEAIPAPEKYSPYAPPKESGSRFRRFSELHLRGKHYYELPANKGRLEFCPVCGDVNSVANSDACTCGTPSINRCINEGKLLEQPHLFCPDCGGETAFKAIYDRLPDRLNAAEINVPDSYDDYIECEYWPFIVFTVGYWEKAKDLYAALEDSVAYYDCKDMVIFVRTERQANLAKQGRSTILTCLEKYGESPIKDIEVMVIE